MNFHKHPCFTYDNHRCAYCAFGFNCNDCEFKKSQIKKKDNRPQLSKPAVIF